MPDLMQNIHKKFYQMISPKIQDKRQHHAERKKNEEKFVLLWMQGRTLHGKHYRPRETTEDIY